MKATANSNLAKATVVVERKSSAPQLLAVPSDEQPPVLVALTDDETDALPCPTSTSSASVQIKLCVCRFFAAWGDRLWNFCLGLMLVHIGGNLQLAAVSGMLCDACAVLLSPPLGRWIDRTARLRGVRTCLAGHQVLVGLSALFLYSAMQVDPLGQWYRLQYVCTTAAIVLSSLSYVANKARRNIVVYDWTVCVADSCTTRMAALNVWMVRIDQLAMITSPLAAGQLMSSFGLSAACLAVVGWSLLSIVIEYCLLTSIHNGVSSISKSKPEPVVDHKAVKLAPTSIGSRLLAVCGEFLSALRVYYKQTAFAAALAHSLLYLSVLNLDGVTTGYVYQQGVSERGVGLMRAAGGVLGLLASFTFLRLRRHLGLVWTGWVSLLYQNACDVLVVVSIFLPGSPFDPVGYFSSYYSISPSLPTDQNSTLSSIATTTDDDFRNIDENHPQLSIYLFVIGAVLARYSWFGVWTVSLSISQIIQETVDEHNRCSVFGVHTTMRSAFNLVKNALIIGLPDAREFGIHVMVTWAAVVVALCLYTAYTSSVLRTANRKTHS